MRALQLRNTDLITENHQSNKTSEGERDEPPRPPERRVNNNPYGRTLRIPHTIAIGGNYPESIFTGRDVSIVCRSPRAGLDPVLVQPLKFVFERNVFGRDEAQTCVVNLKVCLSGLDLDRLAKGYRFVLNKKVFDEDRRRLRVDLYRFSVNHRNPLLGGEPQLTIASLPACRLSPAIAFHIQEPIFLTVGDGKDALDFSLGEVIEILPADPVNSQVATHPKS